MRWLPHERLTLGTSDAADVVATRLAKMVALGWFFLRNPPRPFRGTLAGRHFKIVRVLGTFLGLQTHNSWQPVIVGEIAPAPEGTEVRMTMRLHAFVAAFTALWLVFGLSFFLISLWTALGRGFAAAAPFLLGVCVVFFPGYALAALSFWSEVRKARVLLCEGLGCRELEGRSRLVR